MNAPGNPEVRSGKSIAIIKALIDKGADVNAKNNRGATPLLGAIGSTEGVRLLIGHGADVNARDDNGWTPLESALLHGCPATVRVLESAGKKE